MCAKRRLKEKDKQNEQKTIKKILSDKKEEQEKLVEPILEDKK